MYWASPVLLAVLGQDRTRRTINTEKKLTQNLKTIFFFLVGAGLMHCGSLKSQSGDAFFASGVFDSVFDLIDRHRSDTHQRIFEIGANLRLKQHGYSHIY